MNSADRGNVCRFNYVKLKIAAGSQGKEVSTVAPEKGAFTSHAVEATTPKCTKPTAVEEDLD